MGDYLLRLQLENGAFPGGYEAPRFAYVFDTGQIIFGLVALFRAFSTPKYLSGASKAGDWLAEVQSADGRWNNFDHAKAARAYHARVAWALCVLGYETGNPTFIAAARRSLDWILVQQRPSSWYASAELRGSSHPVTHTIAYTIEGMLESGITLDHEPYITGAIIAAEALLRVQHSDGSLDGAFDSDWRPMTRSVCLTECAQMSLVWSRLYEFTGATKYRLAALRADQFLMRAQVMTGRHPNIGAIKESVPFWGSYERFWYPNWATKFFADALMRKIDSSPRFAG